MNSNQNFTLINGIFSNEEALEIVLNLYSQKINFHKVKNWSSSERLGKEDADSLKRIVELEIEKERFEKYLTALKSKNQKVYINTEIKVSFSEVETIKNSNTILNN